MLLHNSDTAALVTTCASAYLVQVAVLGSAEVEVNVDFEGAIAEQWAVSLQAQTISSCSLSMF